LLSKLETVAETSAAPLPSASSVTPANLGGSEKETENCSREGEKKSSAVEPRTVKRIMEYRERRVMERRVVRGEGEQ